MKIKNKCLILAALFVTIQVNVPQSFAQNRPLTPVERRELVPDYDQRSLDGTDNTNVNNPVTNESARQEQRAEERNVFSPGAIALISLAVLAVIFYAVKSTRRKNREATNTIR